MSVHLRSATERPRRRRFQAVAAVAAAALIAVTAAACGGDSGKSSSAGGDGVLTIGINRELSSLNPAIDSGLSGGGFIEYLPYATLVIKNPADGTYAAGLAEKFGYIGTGNKTYELKLRSDAKFSDGTPVNAEAVKKWFTAFPGYKGTLAGFLEIASVETPDDLTVRMNLKTASPLVTDYLAGAWGMVIAPSALADEKVLSAGAPGAGPYAFDPKQTVTGKGATYTFLPNTHYYDQKQVKWKKIVIKVIDDPATMLRSMQSGQIDVAMGSVSTVSAARDAKLQVSTAPGGWTDVSLVDATGTKTKALGDVRVRQALNYAIDREGIAKSLFGGNVEPTSEIVTTDAFDTSAQNMYSYDPEKAKQLLAEAGYPDGFTMGLVAPTFGALAGKPLTAAVVQDWEDIGVKVKVTAPATNAELFQKFLSESAYMLDYPSIATYTGALKFLPTSPINPYKVNDTVINDLVARAQTAPPEEQAEIAKQINARVLEQAYMVPIATNPNILYYSKAVSDVTSQPWLVTSPVALTWNPSS